MRHWGWLFAIAMLLTPLHRASAASQSKRGATVPWVPYEAEQASTNGTTIGPDYIGRTPAREASGRSCVRLAATGQYLEFVAKADAQGVVVRYCIPDSADGRGMDAT